MFRWIPNDVAHPPTVMCAQLWRDKIIIYAGGRIYVAAALWMVTHWKVDPRTFPPSVWSVCWFYIFYPTRKKESFVYENFFSCPQVFHSFWASPSSEWLIPRSGNSVKFDCFRYDLGKMAPTEKSRRRLVTILYWTFFSDASSVAGAKNAAKRKIVIKRKSLWSRDQSKHFENTILIQRFLHSLPRNIRWGWRDVKV